MKEKIKVECLYRVSSSQQVSGDGEGIPLQEKACREYAKKNGWEIVKEYHELGISGYHISASKRDAIIALKEDAEARKFDILLVYMCDRIGRIAEETPFVVEWFISHGIRVVSAREGEQRIENHADKLMNFIRYWQSEGESVKTSMRVKDRMDQLRKSGNFVGGVIPYGYRKIKGARVNKRNEVTADIEINPAEAGVIREIYQRTIKNGIAHQQIADDLTSRGIRTHNGNPFTRQTVKQILMNERYTGHIITKNVKSPYQERLKIIDKDIYNTVQEIIAKRSHEYREWQETERIDVDPLLKGMKVCCAVCGEKITVTIPAKGAVRKTAQYVCKKEKRSEKKCDGQHSFYCNAVDSIVLKRTLQLLCEFRDFQKKVDKSIVFSNALGKDMRSKELQLK